VRRRDIDPAIWQDEKFGRLSIGAQLLFIWTWNDADDWGVLRWRPERCKSGAFLYKPRINLGHVREYMAELEAQSMICAWDACGERWAVVRMFLRWQSVNKPALSKCVAPPSDVVALLPPPMEWRSYKVIRALVDRGAPEVPGWVASCARVRSPGPFSGAESESGSETDPEKKGKNKVSKTTSSHSGKPERSNDVSEVFNHWKSVMRKDRAKCPDKRKAVIVRALQSYSVEDCKAAIDGCAKTPFNMGDNDRHQPYNDIELILRDAAHIDRFMEAASGKAVPKSVPAADFRALERAAEREWQKVMQAGASNDFQKIGFAVAMLHERTVAALKVIDKDPANAVWRMADIPLREQLTFKAAFIPAWKASGIPYEVDE